MTSSHSEKDDAEDITIVDVSNKDGTDQVPVIIILEVANILGLRKEFPINEQHEGANFIFSKRYLKSGPVLTYKGKTKIRKDVLKKYKNIADSMQIHPLYPNFKLQHMKKIIKNVIPNSDRRTYDNFIKSINQSIHSCSGKKLILYNSIDCSCFVNLVDDKISDAFL